MNFAPLRKHRDFRCLFAAQFISFLGTMVTYVALPYQVYSLTHSSFAVGMLGLAELFPLLVTAFIGGVLADSMDRRRMVLITELALGACSAVLMLNAMLTKPMLWVLFVIAGTMSALTGLQRPSLEAITPRLLQPDEIPAAAGLASFRGSIGMIGGPALGGILIASAGLPFTFGADVLSYACSLIFFRMIRSIPPQEKSERPGCNSVLEGFRYARSRQELLGSYVVDFVAMVFGMPLALLPAISESLGGPKVLGTLYAAPAMGALVASLLSRWNDRVKRHGAAIMIAASVWGIAIVIFGFTKTLVPAVIFLALAGGADCVSGMFRMTLWNQTIPDALRGRLAAIEMVSYMSGPLLGHAEAGAIAALWSVKFSVVSGGILCVIGVAVCALLLPGFTRYKAATVHAEHNS